MVVSAPGQMVSSHFSQNGIGRHVGLEHRAHSLIKADRVEMSEGLSVIARQRERGPFCAYQLAGKFAIFVEQPGRLSFEEEFLARCAQCGQLLISDAKLVGLPRELIRQELQMLPVEVLRGRSRRFNWAAVESVINYSLVNFWFAGL